MLRARIVGHPLHPALVHFPLALWFIAILWDMVGWWQADPLWWRMGYWCLALGVVASLPAIVAGLLDYLALDPHDPGINVATVHSMVMMSATAVFGASWVVRTQTGSTQAPSMWAFTLALIGAVLLAVGGWLGGTLVYRYGIGRMDADKARRRDDTSDGNMP